MSVEGIPAQAGPSGSKSKRMVDGREETKEERKARKEAKRAKKAAETAEGSDKAADVPESSVGPAATDVTQTTATEKKAGKKEKKRKRTAEEGIEPITNLVGGSGTAQMAESNNEEVTKEALDPAEEKRAKKAARKAKRAAEEADKAQKSSTTRPGLSASNGDPSDPALSDHARKALAYVQSHAASHLSQGTAPPGQAWKFNKANQNWLIRNVWNESEVPEEYVDDVMRYLNTIKGGGRTALIEMAEKCATAPIQESLPTDAPDATVPNTEPTATQLPGPADTAATSGTATAPGVSPEEAQRDREVIRARAERLLKLLKA